MTAVRTKEKMMADKKEFEANCVEVNDVESVHDSGSRHLTSLSKGLEIKSRNASPVVDVPPVLEPVLEEEPLPPFCRGDSILGDERYVEAIVEERDQDTAAKDLPVLPHPKKRAAFSNDCVTRNCAYTPRKGQR